MVLVARTWCPSIPAPEDIINDKELEGLPEPTRRYFRERIRNYFRNGYDMRFLWLRYNVLLSSEG